jgi:hypothetical protein
MTYEVHAAIRPILPAGWSCTLEPGPLPEPNSTLLGLGGTAILAARGRPTHR